MRATIVLALVTSGLSHLGVIEAAELTYVATSIASWTFGGRAITDAIARERTVAVVSHLPRSPSTAATLS